MNLKKLRTKLFQGDVNDCVKKICSLIEFSREEKILVDLGCNDGSKTERFAFTAGLQTNRVIGADINQRLINYAKRRNITPILCNFEINLPFKSEIFDIVVTNQVIEHLTHTDLFIQNIFRILKRGGYTIIATENISYWANIVALILGYQGFSQNISDYYHVGNPFSTLAGTKFPDDMTGYDTHKRIFSIKGLPALLSKYDFKIEAVLGAGFAPLPSIFSRIDKIHARFIVVKARKM